ncbi:MAG TPA: sugar nucleotide-binding protein [Pirellulales bacterium]|nr:sugar nucleotide-binding protein [Pirellulales bacterium]
MERLLITGIDRLIGANLALVLADRFDVLGLYDRLAVESDCFRSLPDESGQVRWAQLVGDFRPQWMIHCGSSSAASWDTRGEASAADRETQRLGALTELAASLGARLTVITSDVVLAGPRMFHDESSAATSPAPRAVAVRRVETTLAGTPALVVRTHAYGWSPTGAAPGFAEEAFRALDRGQAFEAPSSRHATPILATDLANLLVRAYELRLHGLFHLAGAERTSAYRFARELGSACGIGFRSEGLSCTAEPAWPDETSLSSKRARRALEMATPLLREGLERFAEQATNGWRERWRTSAVADNRHEIAA